MESIVLEWLVEWLSRNPKSKETTHIFIFFPDHFLQLIILLISELSTKYYTKGTNINYVSSCYLTPLTYTFPVSTTSVLTITCTPTLWQWFHLGKLRIFCHFHPRLWAVGSFFIFIFFSCYRLINKTKRQQQSPAAEPSLST
jgi:hypothetical protein